MAVWTRLAAVFLGCAALLAGCGGAALPELRPAENREEPALTLAGQPLVSSVLVQGGSFETDANLEAVFQACGFDTSFYEYNGPDGRPQLTLWYDAEAETGAGIRYRGLESGDTILYGFGFQGVFPAEGDRWYRWKKNLTAPPEAVLPGVEDMEEERTYDGAGRLTAFSSSGRLEEPGGEGERVWICHAEWTYDADGTLLRGSFGQNPMLFGTTESSREFFCDGLGRLCYERAYITHGSLDYYYIYEDESAAAPAYCLYLDGNLGTWFPELVRYS